MKVAIVADWLVTYAGAERVLSQLLEVYPDADIFSLVDFLSSEHRKFIRNKFAKTSFIQNLPFARSKYRAYLTLMPLAVERFNLSDYKLIISNSHAVAKGVITHPGQLHVCYLCARNLKYAYEDRFFYPGTWIFKFVQDLFLSKIRVWDAIASQRPQATIALSEYVRHWHTHRHGIDSTVIYPPVDTTFFSQHYREEKEDFYITVGRLEPYKRIDLIISAFNRLGKKLVVVGSGTQERTLKKLAAGNVEFLGFQDSKTIADLLSRANAFVFASREDFGIAPLEAQACGTPVIAYGGGGVRETIRDLEENSPTGVLFGEQTEGSLADAVRLFEREGTRITSKACCENAQRFSADKFREKIKSFIEGLLTNWAVV